MKLTGPKLRKFLREEIVNLLMEYEQSIYRQGDKLFLIDDDGNDEFFGTVTANPEFDQLADGEAVPYESTESRSRDRLSGRDEYGDDYRHFLRRR